MFKFFKKEEKPQSIESLVESIHKEFDSAEERLLVNAKRILDEAKVSDGEDRRYLENLKSLGFENVPFVKENENKISEQDLEISRSKELSELILFYKTRYMFQKFLTEKELNRICEKYNLIWAPVAHYKKDVPKKNLEEILKAKPLEEDYMASDVYHLKASPEKKLFFEIMKKIGYPECILTRMDIRNLLKKYKGYSNSTWENPVIETVWLYSIARKLGYDGLANGGYYESVEVTKREGLYIAAPKEHFDLEGLDMKGKFGYVKITKFENPDPIVFRFCKGGIQVLTKWGLEARDESLIIPEEN